MNVQEFQKRLEELCRIAKENGGVLRTEDIRQSLEGMELDKSQLVKVLRYLQVKGITVETAQSVPEAGAAESTPGSKAAVDVQEPERQAVALTRQEEAYLAEYRAQCRALGNDSDQPEEELFDALARGEDGAGERLARRYMERAAELAVEMNCEGLFLGDLIQEANMSLWSALGQAEPERKSGEWLECEIRRGIRRAVEEQEERKFEDEVLVTKVRTLENAVRELTEDGEDNKFSIGELSVILDMDVEEIRGVLRLTGDDK